MSVATALTVYGIETKQYERRIVLAELVATALTVYGIETDRTIIFYLNFFSQLQQHLPFTVLKLVDFGTIKKRIEI